MLKGLAVREREKWGLGEVKGQREIGLLLSIDVMLPQRLAALSEKFIHATTT